MAIDVTRAADDALNTLWASLEPTLDGENIPADQKNKMKAQAKLFVDKIVSAIFKEIKENAETEVSESVNSMVTALRNSTTVPQDGGAMLKTSTLGGYPAQVKVRIK
ncbi:MAG: hypothetical protein V1799_07425 [bacterium]